MVSALQLQAQWRGGPESGGGGGGGGGGVLHKNQAGKTKDCLLEGLAAETNPFACLLPFLLLLPIFRVQNLHSNATAARGLIS